MDRAGDISLGTKTTEVEKAIGWNIQLQIVIQLQARLTELTWFRGLCPKKTRSLACRYLGLKVEFGEVEVETRKVDLGEEGRIIGKDELVGSESMSIQTPEISVAN